MKKQNLQAEKLDEIGTRLIKSASLKDEEIEKIISKPHLFDSIKTRIADDKIRRKKKNVFANWFDLVYLQRPKTGFAVAVLGILAMVLGAFLFNQTASEKVLIAEKVDNVKSVVDSNAPTEIPAFQPPTVEENAKFTKVKEKVNKREITAKAENRKFVKPLRKNILPPPKQTKKIDDAEIFYPLTFAGDFSMQDSRQIIRVELTQDSLAALGINYPLADENEKVRADLLVGSDGQPQAYRFVNNF